jgi:hypothetical protein
MTKLLVVAVGLAVFLFVVWVVDGDDVSDWFRR